MQGTVSSALATRRRQAIEAFSPLRTADQVLFTDLIDYAGLFPPSSLPMAEAVAEYRRARTGPHRRLLGRFICTASRLEELAGLLMSSMKAGEEPWPISVILDGDVARAAVSAHTFDAEMDPAAGIALLEVPLPAEVGDGRSTEAAGVAAGATIRAALTASTAAIPFFEVPLTPQWERGVENAVAAVARLRDSAHRPLGAKLRCGGAVPAAFPEPLQVAGFIQACTKHTLPFKATAGLHHPIRHHDPELDVMRHGFLNLLVAAALAGEGAATSRLVEAIEETDPTAFSMARAGLTWRDQRLGVGLLSRTREQFAGYGSCSFSEPVEDLVALGMTSGPG